MKAMVKNAADETQVRKAELDSKFTRDDELEVVRSILQTPAGRKWVYGYLETCRVFHTSFTGTSETYFLEGRRDVGLRLLDDVTSAEADMFMLMLKENKGDDNGRTTTSRARSTQRS